MRNRFKKTRILFLLCIWAISAGQILAQSLQISGKVTDAATGDVIPGVNVVIKGTTQGTITNFDGEYSITVQKGSTLAFTFVGYNTEEKIIQDAQVLNMSLIPDIQRLDEVVVIGYGTSRKGDLTGAVSNVTTKDFNKGIITSPEQLINGKISGVQIMSKNGSPTGGNTIRIRGGASLNASNDPLIVLDGVPLEAGGISGNDDNFLSLINPNDIESITVLKDASSTAIYGSRASNGVIMITTKKSSGEKLKISFNTTNSLQTKTKLADMLSTDEFRKVVETKGSSDQKKLLGTENTNWNDEIYQLAFGTDNSLSVSGAIKKLPYRVSLGYYNQNGILKTDNSQRLTGNLSLTPSLMEDHLKLTLGLKGSLNKNQFAKSDAIWGGSTYNPTIPIHSGSTDFGGYTEAIDNGKPVTSAVLNPVGLLDQYSSTSNVNRVIGNFDVDYKMHFLPELKFHASLGYDYAEGKGQIVVPAAAAQYFVEGGRNYEYGPQKLENRLLTTYFNYNKNLENINSVIDVTAGYDYQYWKSTKAYYDELNVAGEVKGSTAATDYRHVLLSYYGRLNYTLASKYMLTATIRRDGTSRFSKDNRWGTFPSVALAWRISEETFIKDLNIFSNLKLRASYGITGQQEGKDIGNYNYQQLYTRSQAAAHYIFGETVVYTYRPEPFVSNLKWETTKAYNYGLDFGFFKNRLSGSFEYYTRKTEDLLATVPSPAGTNFEKTITTNVGNVNSNGIELTLNATPIDNKDWTWNVTFNASMQEQEVTNLSIIKGAEITNSSVGPTIDNYYFQVLTEGYAPNMFWVYHQLYDPSGKPIEGAYADINTDGEINDKDRYRYHSPAPDYLMGFSTSLRYKKWSLGTSLRANIGNYVYNGMAMNTGAFGTMSYNQFQLNNLHKSYLETGFQSRQYLSDYYVENASFLKMDNLSLGYLFESKWFDLNITGMVQNVFTITKYTGVDPEVPEGMDRSFYPRPRIYSLSLGFNFKH